MVNLWELMMVYLMGHTLGDELVALLVLMKEHGMALLMESWMVLELDDLREKLSER